GRQRRRRDDRRARRPAGTGGAVGLGAAKVGGSARSAAVIGPAPGPTAPLPDGGEIAAGLPVELPPRPGVHRGPAVAGDEAVGRSPGDRLGRILLRQRGLGPGCLGREDHRVAVGPFAERVPLADPLRVLGEGALGIDRGRNGGGAEQQGGSDHNPSGSARPARRCAATRVLRMSMAIVIGPTPPGTGVIAPATSAASAKATSPTKRPLPSSVGMRLIPTSMTVAPGLIQSPRTISGRPIAATTMSARRTTSGRSRVREWQMVTVAFSLSNSAAIGLP